MAVQEGPTSIQVSWTPPTPLGDTTGYRIYYSGGSSGSVNVSGGSTDTHQLSDLRSGHNYTISIVGTSEHLPSVLVNYNISLSELYTSSSSRYYNTPLTVLHSNSSRHTNCSDWLKCSFYNLHLLEYFQWLSSGEI